MNSALTDQVRAKALILNSIFWLYGLPNFTEILVLRKAEGTKRSKTSSLLFQPQKEARCRKLGTIHFSGGINILKGRNMWVEDIGWVGNGMDSLECSGNPIKIG